ncbi:MAG: dependent ligase domain, partial [Chloroflexota bacterium]|nr:dependent ligase domain [Chloroflexota bacterium]
MPVPDAASAAASWRPQAFGDKRANRIADPIVEPLWTGPRIVALVERGAARLIDAEGVPIDEELELAAALVEATGGATVVIEAFLTPEPLQAMSAIAGREVVVAPNVTDTMTQMVIGTRGNRKDRLAERRTEARRRSVDGVVDQMALVAVDLLWLDDESLCDVPLLERKRILESVLTESHLIRVGAHVKPPIDTWLGSWRTFGFRRVSFKAANSRYFPGEKNQEW